MLESLNVSNEAMIDSNLLPPLNGSGFDDFGSLNQDVTSPPENTKIARLSPGGSSICVSNQARSVNVSPPGPDGGFITKLKPVDPNQVYRLCLFIKRHKTQNTLVGRIYFGVYTTRDAVEDPIDFTGLNVHTLGSSTTTHSNPYFFYGFLNEAYCDEWLLVVSHMRPYQNTSQVQFDDTGVYRMSGEKITDHGLLVNPNNAYNEFRMQADTIRLGIRAFMYYAETQHEFTDFVSPRIDLVNGRQPSIQSLINDFTVRQLVKRREPFYQPVGMPYARFKVKESQPNFASISFPFYVSAESIISSDHPTGVGYYESAGPENNYYTAYTDITISQTTTIQVLAKARDGVVAMYMGGRVMTRTKHSDGLHYCVSSSVYEITLEPGTHRLVVLCCTAHSQKHLFACTVRNKSTQAKLRGTTSSELNLWKWCYHQW
jgi:hypothetical protein